MANVRTTAPIAAAPQADPYYEAQRQQALAEMLAKRANASAGPDPRTSQAALLNGLNDILASSASRKAADRAQVAKSGADRVVSDQNRALIQAMMQGKGREMPVEGLDSANPGFDIQLPGKLDPTAPALMQAVSGLDPMQVKGMLAKTMYERAMPDPSQVADRELKVMLAEQAAADRKAAREQRIEELRIRAADTRALEEDRQAARRELAQLQAGTQRDIAGMRDEAAASDRALRREMLMMKIEADKAKAPATTSQESALGFLADLGFDQSGEDEVTRLLKVASGGIVDQIKDTAARAVNKSTEGSRANADLKSIASDKVLDFLGGKLGSGVSNADRDFMMQRAGDIGNEKLSTGERLAAWNGIVTRMKAAAGAAPAAPGAPASPAASSPPANALKEGVVTTFANGQSWTLRNGQAVKVQ